MNGFNQDNSSVESAGADPALTALLLDSYAAPADPEYWAGLEQRVMSEIQHTQLLRSIYSAPSDVKYWADFERRVLTKVSEQRAWWAVLPEWRAAGMVAAAAALFLVGAIAIRDQQNEAVARERAAIEAEFTIFDSTIEPVNMAISSTSPDAQHARSAAPERFLDLIRP